MRRKAFWGALALAVAVAAVSAAVAVAGKSSSKAPSGEITLAGWASSPTETALLQQVLRGFEHTFPKIKVNYAPISGDYPAAMLARFASRTPPDVFYVDSNVIPDWIKQGVLEPLDPYIAKNKFNTGAFFPSLLNGFKGPDGKIYGLPKDWSPLAMESNNKFLAAAGVKPPTDWTSLKLAAEKLKGKVPGGRPICLSPTWDRLLAFVYQNGGSFLSADKKSMAINSPAATAAVSYYVGLIQSGLAGTPAQLGVGWCGEALGKEKAAIAFEGNWLFPFMSSTFPNVKFTTSQLVKQKQAGNLAFTVSYSMARDSKNKDAAWQLIRYLESKPGMKTWTSKGLALPSRKDVQPVAGRQAFTAQADASHPWQFAPTFTKVIDIANNELSAVIEGKENIGTMMKKISDAGNQALKG
jgi:multiple sugar transport system substrate-binding protein